MQWLEWRCAKSVLGLVALCVSVLVGCGSSKTAANPNAKNDGFAVALPLRTASRFIVDANGKRVKFAGVNWYGGESPDLVPLGLDHNDVQAIAHQVKALGFNVVRLPWALETVERNPTVSPLFVSANPSLVGKSVLEVLDAVIAALARENVMVVLDNHRSHGDWCCDTAHGDGLWHTLDYPEANFIADWRTIVDRYKSVPAVVGADLRNEIRGQLPDDATACADCGNPNTSECTCLQPSWGDNDPATDWAAAAERAGNAVLEENPNLLIVVGGNFYSTWFGASYRPITLSQPNRLVYAPHNYSSSNGGFASFADYDAFASALDSAWGYLVTPGQPYTGPVWVNEFGTNHTNVGSSDPNAAAANTWWGWIRQYMTAKDLDFAVWALNGTQGAGYGRTLGAEETFGVLDTSWAAPAPAPFIADIQSLEPATLAP